MSVAVTGYLMLLTMSLTIHSTRQCTVREHSKKERRLVGTEMFKNTSRTAARSQCEPDSGITRYSVECKFVVPNCPCHTGLVCQWMVSVGMVLQIEF